MTVTLNENEARDVLKTLNFLVEEGYELLPTEVRLREKIRVAFEAALNSPPKVPEPPRDPHREDDEYEPPLGLSQDH